MIISDHPLENPFLDAINNLIYGYPITLFLWTHDNLFYGDRDNFSGEEKSMKAKNI